MYKNEINKLIDKVANTSLEEIIGLRVNLTKNGRSYLGLCPFHADTKLGSFVVTPHKNIWKCFACGSEKSGFGGISFIMKLDNDNFLEAVFKIGYELSYITLSEYDRFYENMNHDEKEIKRLETKYAQKQEKKTFKNNKADIKILDKVYELFSSCCNLTNKHYQQLKDVRQLNDNRIKKDYFTFPTNRIMEEFIKKLKDVGYDETILQKVPGFYYDKQIKKMTFYTYKGIGILLRNSKGQIESIQIRRDKATPTGGRYILFSSSFAQEDERYEFGVGSGSPCDVVFPTEIKNPIIAITEGKFKAEKLAENNLIAISVQGVGSWKGILNEIKEIQKMPEYIEVLKKFKRYTLMKNMPTFKTPIYVCFDSDMIPNYQVFEQARKMTDSLQLELEEYQILYINWLEQYGKGIDDLIINNKIDRIKKYSKCSLDKTHATIMNIIKNEQIPHNYETIQKVPKEIMRNYFFKYFYEKPIAI